MKVLRLMSALDYQRPFARKSDVRFAPEGGHPGSIGRRAIEVEVADHILAVAPVELFISLK